ncbi:5-oxoprolinase subunit B [Cognatishimia sp. WU-CL00825]|uniref:5-oxoprolinase subunit B family protein n=1 Tax=Cognatishimia sp. WU-CL00825 TaxID=3127658 RepID=UPI0031088388
MTRADHQETPQILRFGSNSLIVRFGLQASVQITGAVRAFLDAIENANFPWVEQSAGSLASVMIDFDVEQITSLAALKAVEGLVSKQNWLNAERPPATRRWHIPVSFGAQFGPQLAEVAALANLSEAQAVTELTAADIEVLTIGFAPGQPYLGLLPEHWNMPRQSTINPQVLAGSLVVAVRQLVLFSAESPTGWRHIGQSGFRPFMPQRDEPILLQAGDVARFHAVSSTEMRDLLLTNPQGLGGAYCEAIS